MKIWAEKRVFMQPTGPLSQEPQCVNIRMAETSLPEAGDGGEESLEGTRRTSEKFSLRKTRTRFF